MQAINTKKFAQNAFKLDVSRTKKAMTINRTSAPKVKTADFLYSCEAFIFSPFWR